MVSTKILVSACVAAVASAAPATGGASAKTLYFLVNDPAGSQLASVPVTDDCTLAYPSLTPTGGKGRHAINATDNSALGPDSLIGQGAVSTEGEYVFTVNTGSNTASMFKIDPSKPTKPTLVGKPADTLGEFPVSITYSKQLKTACVLNGGSKNGVTCFGVSDKGLSPLDKAPRSLSPYLNQTTPPRGPPMTASQIQFSPDSRFLLADVKGDTMPNSGMPGTIFVYPVQSGKVAQKAITTQIKDMTGNFGFTFFAPDKVLMSDVGYGGSMLSIGSDFKATEMSHLVIPSQGKAPCWAAHSSELNTGYIVESAKAEFSKVDLKTGKLSGAIDYDPSLMGGFDTVVDDKKAYFLTGVSTLGVVDLVTGKTVQKLELGKDFPARSNWQGLVMNSA